MTERGLVLRKQLIEEIKKKELDTINAKKKMQRFKSQEELKIIDDGDDPRLNEEPISPDNREFSPKDALRQNLRRTIGSPEQTLSIIDERSNDGKTQLKFLSPAFSLGKLHNVHKTDLLSTNSKYGGNTINQRYKMMNDDEKEKLIEGRHEAAFRRFEAYENKRTKLVNKIHKKLEKIK